ncbi:MAG: hypothetical protein QOK40_2078 [Miltoncostaeaceae bacterium]|nr:hypothetical protein [Miltoncostaeaceae bacterium]
MDELDLVRGLYDAADDDGDPAVERRVRAALADRIRAGAPRRRRRLGWRVALPAAAVIAVAAGLALGPGAGLLSGPDAGRADAAVVRAMNTIAEVAAAQPATADRAPGAGEWVYTRSQGLVQVTSVFAPEQAYSYTERFTREAWIGGDGSLRLVESHCCGHLMTAKDRAMWRASGAPDITTRKESDETYHDQASLYVRPWQDQGLTDAELIRLAGDPPALAERIRLAGGGAGPSPAEEMFTIVGDILREAGVAPEARAALFAATPYIPGVTLVGRVTDAAGRPGLAVAQTTLGSRRELIFDQATAALLAERTVVADPAAYWDPEVPAGTVTEEMTYLASGLVSTPTGRVD